MTGQVVCGYRLLRELGARALPTYAAVDPKRAKAGLAGLAAKAGDTLCVVEQLAREPGVSAESAAEFLRDAKRLAHLHHPNVIRVRDVVVGTNTVLLVSDWVDGEALSDVERVAAAKSVAVPLAASLRVLVDLLEGLSALHELRDAKREPLALVHAEVAPCNLIVSIEGRSVLAHPLRAPGSATRRKAPEIVGYLAPEVLLGDQTADQRADVYGAGVVLWEALMGQRMHVEGEDVGEIVMRILGGKIEAACAPVDVPWAVPLAEVAKRATAPDPSVRFANATAMLADVRRAIGPRLAAKSVVASIVEAVAGERIRARSHVLGVTQAEAQASVASASLEAARDTRDTPPVVLSSDADATQPAPVSSSSKIERPTPEAALPSVVIDDELAADAITPAIASSSDIVFAPPSSSDVIEVVELEIPQDKPSRPRAPPPFRPREKLGDAPIGAPILGGSPGADTTRATSQSKTDLASLALVSTPDAPGVARTKWTIAAAFAIGIVAVAWMLMRAPRDRAESSEPPATAPSSAVSTTEAPAPPSSAPPPSSPPPNSNASATPAASAAPSSPAANEPSPFDPQVAEDHAPLPARAPASKDPTPFPTAPSAAPPPPPPAPASTSPHPKKRVYDPMGI